MANTTAPDWQMAGPLAEKLTGDAWEQFCQAAKDWIQEKQRSQVKVLERLHPLALSQKQEAPSSEKPALNEDKKVEEGSLDNIMEALDLGELVLLERALGKRRKTLHQRSSSEAPCKPLSKLGSFAGVSLFHSASVRAFFRVRRQDSPIVRALVGGSER